MAKNKDKKEKILEIYAKASTPQELFIDLVKYFKKLEADFKEFQKVKDTIEDTHKYATDNLKSVNDAVQYVMDNKPKTEKELLEMIKTLIPEVKDGKDGYTYKQKELEEIIRPLIKIPKIKDGKDGSPDTPEEIRDKIVSLKGDDKLSVFSLKDTEYLRGKGGMQWSSAGFKVEHDSSLTGDGTHDKPLKVTGGGGSGAVQSVTGLNTDNTDPTNPIVNISVDGLFISGSGTPADPLTFGTFAPTQVTYSTQTPSGAIDGMNTTYTVTQNINIIINFAINGQYIHPSQYTFTAGTKTIHFITPLDSSLSGLPFTIVFIVS